jgi:uncharacterized membrane protein
MPVKETPKSIGFRWSYIALPAAVLVIVIIITGIFYGKLPQEVAYRFSGSTAVSRLARNALLAWALGAQLVFTLLSVALTISITGAMRRMQLPETGLNRTIFAAIGNIIGLPQIIIAYATLDIFLYNTYEKSLPSAWVFALLVMFIAGVVLVVFFISALIQSQKSKKEIISGSKSDVRK